MSTPNHLRNAPFHMFTLKDITTGAVIMSGRVYQWNASDADIRDGNSYTFVPAISIRPGLMLLFKD